MLKGLKNPNRGDSIKTHTALQAEAKVTTPLFSTDGASHDS